MALWLWPDLLTLFGRLFASLCALGPLHAWIEFGRLFGFLSLPYVAVVVFFFLLTLILTHT